MGRGRAANDIVFQRDSEKMGCYCGGGGGGCCFGEEMAVERSGSTEEPHRSFHGHLLKMFCNCGSGSVVEELFCNFVSVKRKNKMSRYFTLFYIWNQYIQKLTTNSFPMVKFDQN